jgi:hypothetical protein
LLVKTTLTLGVSSILFAASLAGQADSGQTAEVSVVVTIGGSFTIKNFAIRSFLDSGGQDLAPRFAEGRARGVPLGTYRLTVVDPEDGLEEGIFDVDVNSPRTLIIVELDWQGVENHRDRYLFRGALKGRKLTSADSCRASGMYQRRIYDSTVDVTGRFDFGPVRPGTYMLACTVGGRPVALGTFVVNASTNDLVVEVPDSNLQEKVKAPEHSSK